MMQCLADGYFIIPLTIGDYLSRHDYGDVDTDHPAVADAERAVKQRVEGLLAIGGTRTTESLHRELGRLMWDHCGIARKGEDLQKALELIPKLRETFWSDLKITGSGAQLNQSLEHAGRLADFLEFAELMCRDALARDESCGCHFRVEHQTAEGETLRDDTAFAHVSVWEHTGEASEPVMHKEPLAFQALPLAQRNYKT
jgi:succinate dehydrogenase / fumarate reductase flavoprotein subunit